MSALDHLDEAVSCLERAEAALRRARQFFPERGASALRGVIDVEIGEIRSRRHHVKAAADTERREHMSEDERRRFDEGRHDWRDEDWEDHCGRIGCAVCDARPTRL